MLYASHRFEGFLNDNFLEKCVLLPIKVCNGNACNANRSTGTSWLLHYGGFFQQSLPPGIQISNYRIDSIHRGAKKDGKKDLALVFVWTVRFECQGD